MDVWFGEPVERTLHAARAILPLVFKASPPQSVVDVGCGPGMWLQAAWELGSRRNFGIDAETPRNGGWHIGNADFLSCNLTAPPKLAETFDLAISLETAEHLPQSAGEGFVAYLCSLAPAVLFSAAIPGQGGVNHINERWQSYWAALFEAQGMTCLDTIRPAIWDDDTLPVWYRQNTFLFTRDAVQAPTAKLPCDIVHPLLFTERTRVTQRVPTIKGSLRDFRQATRRRFG